MVMVFLFKFRNRMKMQNVEMGINSCQEMNGKINSNRTYIIRQEFCI